MCSIKSTPSQPHDKSVQVLFPFSTSLPYLATVNGPWGRSTPTMCASGVRSGLIDLFPQEHTLSMS